MPLLCLPSGAQPRRERAAKWLLGLRCWGRRGSVTYEMNPSGLSVLILKRLLDYPGDREGKGRFPAPALREVWWQGSGWAARAVPAQATAAALRGRAEDEWGKLFLLLSHLQRGDKNLF